MAFPCRTLFKNYSHFHYLNKPLKWSVGKNYPIRILSSGISYQDTTTGRLLETWNINFVPPSMRQYSSQGNENTNKPSSQGSKDEKPGLIQRFKQMYRDYWYVLLPVHMATSAVWFGSMYYAVRSGVDVIGLLQSLGVSETLIGPLRDSSAGYVALAFALYKMVTPFRYAVTVGGTTYAIKKLTALGLIKPVPSRERIKELLQEKKDLFNESKQHYQTQMKEKRTQVMEEMKRYKSEMRDTKSKVKKT